MAQFSALMATLYTSSLNLLGLGSLFKKTVLSAISKLMVVAGKARAAVFIICRTCRGKHPQSKCTVKNDVSERRGESTKLGMVATSQARNFSQQPILLCCTLQYVSLWIICTPDAPLKYLLYFCGLCAQTSYCIKKWNRGRFKQFMHYDKMHFVINITIMYSLIKTTGLYTCKLI